MNHSKRLALALITTALVAGAAGLLRLQDVPSSLTGHVVGVGTGVVLGETGRVELATTIDDGEVQSITFRNTYTDPVVVAFINTRNGDESIQVRVRSVSGSGCEIFMQEPDNEGHSAETVSYIVMERGRHTLDGGLIVEAGSVETATAHVGGQSFGGDAVRFSATFLAAPAVLHGLNTHNNDDFMASLATGVGVDGFEIGLEAAETGKAPVAETVAWIAFATGSGSTNTAPFQIGAGNDGTDDGVSQTSHSVLLSGFTAAPDIVVSVYGANGTDGSWARGAGTHSDTTQTVYAEEDQVGDDERNHANESFAYAAFEADTDFLEAGRSHKWRIRNAAATSSGQWVFREVKFCADDACATELSGTAIDSGNALSWASAANAFDGDTGTMWKTTDAETEGASWLGLEFDVSSTVEAVYLRTDNAIYHSDDIYLEYYDAVGDVWVITDVLVDLDAGNEQTHDVSSIRQYFVVATEVNADEAQAYCASMGTTLATITHEDENAVAAALCETTGGLLCFTGLNDSDEEGTPVWLDGAGFTYENWNTASLGANDQANSDCVTVSGIDVWWMDYGTFQYTLCGADRPFLCNGPEKTREFAVISTEQNRNNGAAACEALGDGWGLATITNQDEMDTAAALCESTGGLLCFIGMSDKVTEGSPVYDDGSPVLHEVWNTANKGANNNDNEDCVTISGIDIWWMDYGTFQYTFCNVSRPAICSRNVW